MKRTLYLTCRSSFMLILMIFPKLSHLEDLMFNIHTESQTLRCSSKLRNIRSFTNQTFALIKPRVTDNGSWNKVSPGQTTFAVRTCANVHWPLTIGFFLNLFICTERALKMQFNALYKVWKKWKIKKWDDFFRFSKWFVKRVWAPSPRRFQRSLKDFLRRKWFVHPSQNRASTLRNRLVLSYCELRDIISTI